MLPQINLDRRLRTPLADQLGGQLRSLILSGRLLPGTRLPPTRTLAQDLGVSRNIVTSAYEQLQVEGCLEARVGAGTWVADALPEHLLSPRIPDERSDEEAPAPARLSRRGMRTAEGILSPAAGPPDAIPLRPGSVAPEHFPFAEWRRLAGNVWKEGGADLVNYGDARGLAKLRERIAEHLARFRGVACAPDQVVITAGSQQALDLAARLLVDTGDGVAMEEPGYLGARAVFHGWGARLVGLPVDDEGLNVDAAGPELDGVRLLHCTPSHQFPLGVTMSLSRRLRLLDWAHRTGAWIVEDDYDSEFRYDSRPLPALQGMDRHGRVVYVGTLSKVLAPGIRMGYLVLPEPLVEPFAGARALTDHHPPLGLQATVAGFMEEGRLERHIRRMTEVYRERLETLLECLDEVPELKPRASGAGLHVTAHLEPDRDDRALVERAGRAGVETHPLSPYYLATPSRQGVVLGFGVAPPDRIRKGMASLARVLSGMEPRDTERPEAGG